MPFWWKELSAVMSSCRAISAKMPHTFFPSLPLSWDVKLSWLPWIVGSQKSKDSGFKRLPSFQDIASTLTDAATTLVCDQSLAPFAHAYSVALWSWSWPAQSPCEGICITKFVILQALLLQLSYTLVKASIVLHHSTLYYYICTYSIRTSHILLCPLRTQIWCSIHIGAILGL